MSFDCGLYYGLLQATFGVVGSAIYSSCVWRSVCYELKQELIKWLDDTFIDEEDSGALAAAKKLVRKKKWDTIVGYLKDDWKDLVHATDVGIDIYNHLHPHQGIEGNLIFI